MARHAFRSSQVPAPAGAYSAAVSTGQLVFVSAQLPLDGRGRVLEGSAAEQARRALDGLRHQLRSAGLSLDTVAKLTAYVVAPEDAAALDEVIGEYFGEPRPARTVVGVRWLPDGARLQIEAVAVRY